MEAVGAVVSAMVALELTGENVNDTVFENENTSPNPLSAWEQLLQTKFHQRYDRDCPDFLFRDAIEAPKTTESSASAASKHLSRITSTVMKVLVERRLQVFQTIFDALHQLYEDFKVSAESRDSGMPEVGTILANLCRMGGHRDDSPYLAHYRRDLGNRWFRSLRPVSSSAVSGSASFPGGQPFCILSWIDSTLSIPGSESPTCPPSINAACLRLKSILRVYGALHARKEVLGSSDDVQVSQDFDIVRILIEEGFQDAAALCATLSPGVVLPLLEVLHRCRSCHQQQAMIPDDPEIWSLIGREDLRNNAELDKVYSTKGGKHSGDRKHPTFDRDAEDGKELEDKDQDGLCSLEQTSAMFFPEDNRIREVGRLLRSSRPVYLNVPRAIEVSDHDYERLKQEKLLLLSRRVLALPLGRGMTTIGNLRPVPAEPLPLPDLCLIGRVAPTNASLALDTTDCPTDLKVWPDFNNGVAAGLRLPLEEDAGELVSKITRTWIVYNRPGNQPQQSQNSQGSNPESQQNQGNSHGGLLMALGLRGHLTTLEMTDIFDYLTQGTVTTTVGVLLGMAAK